MNYYTIDMEKEGILKADSPPIGQNNLARFHILAIREGHTKSLAD